MKITPWAPNSGCLCHASIEIPKEVVATVKPTEDTHNCCGHFLRVCEIQFKAGARIALENVFAQIMQSIGRVGAALPFPFPVPTVTTR